MLKRMISLLLCAVMLASMLPAGAMALETDLEPADLILEADTESAEPEAEPTEAETEPAEPEAEPTEAETEPVEPETEPVEPETEPAEDETEPEEPELISLEAPELDEAELLMGYLSPLYNSGGASFFGTVGRDRLSAVDQYLYDGMKEQITRIAAGLEDSTRIEVSYSGTGLDGAQADILLVINALILDCPFEMYWYDGCLYYPPAETVRILMTPNAYYQTAGFDEMAPEIDRTKTRQAAAAAENIFDIKTKYEASSDYDKLCAYADEICALVEYDHYAADNKTYTTDISPWTLINVFDGDTATNVVCEGYAEAYQYLCDESIFQGDVVCISATGNAHKWNIIRIDGVGYLMDVTHCDYGDYAYRGPKFFGGGSGSVAEGYVIGGFHYWYDPNYTLPVYGDGEDSMLKLSATAYTPPVTCSIVYDANGGTGAPGSQLKTVGVDLILRDTVPVWDGYTFLGWATTATATAAEYQPGDAYTADGDVTLYAVWEKTVCSHSFGNYTTVTEPTCEKTGMEERTCTLCGETESREIPAAGHDKVTVPGVAATCTEDGLTEGVNCAVCGAVLTKQEVIPAGHTVVDGICTLCKVYGTCGNQLTWSYDSAAETLTISGTGRMEKYTSTQTAPWYSYREAIKNIVIEDGVTILGAYAFAECTALTGIALPPSITSMEKNAFLNCTSLTDIYITDISVWAAGRNSTLLVCNDLGKKLYLNGDLVMDLVIPHGVTAINTQAFRNCSSLRSVTLPDSVQSIGDAAFSQCTNLKEVTLPDSIASIGTGLFSGCTNLSSVKLPANLTSIGSSDFSGCALTGIDLPDSITSIGVRAFFGCRNLSSIELPAELISIDQEAFYGCTGLTSVAVPAKLTTIGLGAFEACQNLRDVYITDLAAWAGSDLGYAFSSSHGNEIWLYLDEQLLTDAVIPDSVTSIGSWAFANCTQLNSVTLPEGITDIGEYAFLAHDGTTGIEQVTFLGDAPAFAENAFSGTTVRACYPANDPTWTADVLLDYGGTITWVPYGGVENQVTIPAAELNGQTSVWIDGKEYAVNTDSGMPCVDLPNSDAKTMVAYTYQNGDNADVHTHIPTGMKVWTLSNTDGLYTAAHVEELDDVLGYAGCSIRVKGNQGIRMVTSLDQADKDALTAAGLAGYTLEEYGTAIAWASQLGTAKPLVLGKSYVSSNYAYKKGVADPIFSSDGNVMQYTNVLVGFSLDQCSDDIAMRPYMILKDAEGNEFTLYGAIVERSIGYIALQNTEKVEEGTEAYDYIWKIITHVYGEVPVA